MVLENLNSLIKYANELKRLCGRFEEWDLDELRPPAMMLQVHQQALLEEIQRMVGGSDVAKVLGTITMFMRGAGDNDDDDNGDPGDGSDSRIPPDIMEMLRKKGFNK
jgi:hypothetical protein